MIDFEVSFTNPIHDYPGEGGLTVGRWPWTDSNDGYFTVPMHLTSGPGGPELDYSDTTDGCSDGFPSTTRDGPNVAIMDDEAFRTAFTDEELPGHDAPSIRLRCLQTGPAPVPPEDWPDLDDVDLFEVSLIIVSREQMSTMIPQADFELGVTSHVGGGGWAVSVAGGAVFDHHSLLDPKVAQEKVLTGITRFSVASYIPDFGGTQYEVFRQLIGGGGGEMYCYVAGEYPWGLHEVTYMGMRIRISTFSQPIRRTYPRDDTRRTWPRPKSVQASNRTHGGYV